MTQDTHNLRAALEPVISRARTDISAVKSATEHGWRRKQPLTEARISAHLNGELGRGVCPIKVGESTTRMLVFDLDDHEKALPWEKMADVAALLTGALRRHGMNPVPWSSSSGRGMHIYLIWDEDQDAYSVREMFKGVLVEIGFTEGAKGVARSEIEIFPKQDSVRVGDCGSQFTLPLYNQSFPLNDLADFEKMPREWALDLLPWPVSPPVPVLEQPVRGTHSVAVLEGADLNRLRDALAAIPNDTDPLGYDEWRNVVAGIHHATGGSEEGYALALEFSARAPHFDETEFEEKVWDWVNNKPPSGKPVTERSIYAKAREHGWRDEARPDEFQDLTVTEPYEVEPLPAFERDSKGRIEASRNNIELALLRPDVCGMDIRYDAFRDEVVYTVPGQPDQWVAFKDDQYWELCTALERGGFKQISDPLMRAAVNFVSKLRKVDSAQVWLESLTWDGVNRVDGFYERYFSAAPGPYTTAVSRYIWTAAAGRVMVPGCQADMVPILTGAQGLGKTRGIRAMVPDDTFRELSFHQPEDTRARLMRGALMVELGELSGLRSREIETIKAWITRSKEEHIPKYVEKMHTFYRRCVIQGTTNDEQFLNDPTGARRWLPLEVGDVDVEGIARDRDQLWAEALLLHRAGGVAWRDAQTLAEGVHENHQVIDTWEEPIATWLATPELDGSLPGDDGVTVHQVLKQGIDLPTRSSKAADAMRCATVLKALGFKKKRAMRNGSRVWLWRRPALSNFVQP
jgi:hypothetical protein